MHTPPIKYLFNYLVKLKKVENDITKFKQHLDDLWF